MDLENRILKDFYPVRYNEENFCMTRNHGVKSLGFISTGQGYEYAIKSPSVEEYGERKYFLNFKNGNYDLDKCVELYSGLIGESIMRITIMEFFRQQSKKIPFNKYDFIKTIQNPNSKEKKILENEKYILEGLTRYNLRVKDKEKHRSIAEYDGVFEYESGRTKGIIVCESKIGRLGYLKSSSDKKIQEKIIRPIKSLFPEHQIDFILMGAEQEILQRGKNRLIRKGLLNLNAVLKEANIGFIPMTFPEPRSKIDHIALSFIEFKKTNDLITNIPEDNKYITYKDTIRLIKGKRIDLILKKTGPNTYTTVYELSKKKKKTK